MPAPLISGISILMCCHNSAGRLDFSLKHLAALDVPDGLAVELVLVDNASTDQTRTVAEQFWANHGRPFPLIVLQEPRLGLSYARMTGIMAAHHDYVLSCDDDNGMPPAYLRQLVDILRRLASYRPQIAMLGGQGVPLFETTPPRWALQFHMFGCGPQGPQSGPVNQLYGAGSLIFRPAFMRLYHAGFRWLLTDRQGTHLSSGGDYELCGAFRAAGYALWYEEELRFWHFIPAQRLSITYYQQFIREASEAENILLLYRALPALSRFPSWLIRWLAFREAIYHLKQILILIFRSLRQSADLQQLQQLRIAYHRKRIFQLLHISQTHQHNWPQLISWYQKLTSGKTG
ncbi:MAG: glycosyltransferase family 2 protein [Thermoflavifilum sp.]|nr:glycosyltransferase family 2 protein [Thermoflavifilum sp.]